MIEERKAVACRRLPCLTAIAALLAIPIASQPRNLCFAFGDPNVIAEFRVGPPGNWLILPVAIGEQSFPFGLDTGASLSIFDTSLRPLLGRPTRPIGTSTMTGAQEFQLYAAPLMRVGILQGRPEEAFCLPVRKDALLSGNDVFGAIGQDFLRDKIIRIDFDRGKVEFLNRLDNPRGERLSLIWKLGAPFVALDIPVVGREEFLIDTGAAGFNSGAIAKPLFKRLLAASELRELAIRGAQTVSPTGTSSDRQARLRRFNVGHLQHDRLIFNESNTSRLDLKYLSRYLVTMDLAHSAIYLEPGRGYRYPDRCHLADFTIVCFDGKTEIWPIDYQTDGVNAPSGVRLADEVISVDGLQAATTSIFELRRLLCTPGERKIRFKRLGEVRELSITLREPDELPPPSLRPKR